MTAEETVFGISDLRLLILSFAIEPKKQRRRRFSVFDFCIGCLIDRHLLTLNNF